MTANQIAFAKLQEEIRHNLAMEGVNYETGMASAGAGYAAAAANLAGVQESARHNQVWEEINWYATIAKADVDSYNANTQFENAITNRENAITNRMNAGTNQYNADINWYNAQTQNKQKDLGYYKFATDNLWNVANMLWNTPMGD